jgi:hypothetical protein
VAGFVVVIVVAAAVAAANMLGASTGTVGSMAGVQRHVGGSAEVVTVDSLEASAPASDYTVGHSLDADIHSAAVVEDTIHIGRLYMPVAASCGCGVDPWRVYHEESSHQKSLYECSIIGGCKVVRWG